MESLSFLIKTGRFCLYIETKSNHSDSYSNYLPLPLSNSINKHFWYYVYDINIKYVYDTVHL